MTTFRYKPATMVISDPEGDIVWVGRSAEYGPDLGGAAAFYVDLPIRGESKTIGMTQLDASRPDQITGISWPSGNKVVIREYVEEDAELAQSLESEIPLPPVVASMMLSEQASNGAYGVEPTLNALADDNGMVATLVLMNDAGAFARYDGQWIFQRTLEKLEDYNSYDVDPEALDLFDQYDQSGQEVHIGSMPLTDAGQKADIALPPQKPAPEPAPEVASQAPAADAASAPDAEPEEPDPEILQAAAMLASGMVTISTEDQLRAVIPVGEADETVRWFIDKRAAALGLQDLIPWSKD